MAKPDELTNQGLIFFKSYKNLENKHDIDEECSREWLVNMELDFLATWEKTSVDHHFFSFSNNAYYPIKKENP